MQRRALHASLCIRQHTSAYVSIRETEAYVSIRQHTSAYVSIPETEALGQPHLQRQALPLFKGMRHYMSKLTAYTSAYVSIRQHTSAYVSIRQRHYMSKLTAYICSRRPARRG
jgi:hypothetical protein